MLSTFNDLVLLKEDSDLLSDHMHYLFNSVPIHIYIKDKNGIYLDLNRGYSDGKNWNSVDMVIGSNDKDLFYEETAWIFNGNDQEVILKETPKTALEYSRSLDGSTIGYFLSHKVPLRTRTGKVIGVIGQSIQYNPNCANSILLKDSLFPPVSLPSVLKVEHRINEIKEKLKISRRQAQCAYYLSCGNTIKQIAGILNLSHRTIEQYWNQLKLKLNFNNRAQLIEMISNNHLL